MMRIARLLGKYNKFLIALTMAILYFLQDYTGVELPIGEAEVAMFWMVITSLFVYLVPNMKGDD